MAKVVSKDEIQKERKRQKFIRDLDLCKDIANSEFVLPESEKFQFDEFTKDSSKLVCCPYGKIITVDIHTLGPTKMVVPCGRCAYCQHKKQNTWIFRNRCEFQTSRCSFFVTLTYNNEHLPENYNLVKRDYQLFIKRFRKNHPRLKFKYFISGEYGAKKGRPHFHLLLYIKNLKVPLSWIKEQLEIAWGNGFVQVSTLNINRICYATKYVQKLKVALGEQQVDIWHEPEFIQCSNGIGLDWCLQHKDELRSRKCYKYQSNTVNGKPKTYTVPVPKYFKQKVFNPFEQWLITISYIGCDSYNNKLKIFDDNRDYSLFNRIRFLTKGYEYKALNNLKLRLKKEKL